MDPADCPLCMEYDREHGALMLRLIREEDLARGESVQSVYQDYLRSRHERGHQDLSTA
ncbi:MAG TPA: hypothetical protein VGR21_04160 [Cryptosporangiaceae bacterium]|nr:hypothetical protein [Cryptosporangiaceae bacterium]